MANNKVQLSDGTVLLDLTGDTVTPQTLLSGATAHNAAGEQISGAAVVGGGTIPDADEIIESWLGIDLNPDSTPGNGEAVDVGDNQIRADTFMGAMISYQDDGYVILPLIMRSDGTSFSSDFSVPLANSAGQCALARITIGVYGGYVKSINLTVQDTFNLSDFKSYLLYDPILFMRPNPT